MGFFGQKIGQTAPVNAVSVDSPEIGKDEDVLNIKGLEALLSGIGFYCGMENGYTLIGTYEEWVAAGKPVLPK